MRIITILVTLTMLFGCATTVHKPFKVERAQIYKEVRTVGIMPLAIPWKVDHKDRIRAELESSIAAKLREGGFSVISSEGYSQIYESMKASVGPLYDPNTGELLKEKHDSLVEHAKREYLRKNKPNALLYSGIQVVKANWSGNHAIWHGVDEPTTGKEGFWASLAASSSYGTIPALSLVLVLKDPQEKVYYNNFGGIQLVQWLKGGTFVDVPGNQLLTDSERNERAVTITLMPLLSEEKIE